MGTTFIAKHDTSNTCSKHADIRSKFVNKFEDYKIVEIIFKSKDYDEDIIINNYMIYIRHIIPSSFLHWIADLCCHNDKLFIYSNSSDKRALLSNVQSNEKH